MFSVLQHDIPYPGQPLGTFGALPPASIVDRRLQELAAANGVLLVPAWYSLKWVGGLQTEEQTFQVDALEGPFICSGILPPIQISSANTWEVTLQSGSRRLIEGRVRGYDLLYVPLAFGEGALPAPVVVLRGDSLKVGISMPAGATVEADIGLIFTGYSIRGPDANRLGSLADDFAALVRREGELYAAGVVNSVQDSITMSSSIVVQTIVADREDGEAVDADTLRVQLGNLDVFPQGLQGAVFTELMGGDLPAIHQNLRMPIPAGQRLTLVPSYSGVGTRSDCRVAVIGRRMQGS